MYMFEKKYVINKSTTQEVQYTKSNVNGIGGKIIPSNTNEISKYKTKNYIQRQKKRRDTVLALIDNNFSPNRSIMLTLTFGEKGSYQRYCKKCYKNIRHEVYSDYQLIEQNLIDQYNMDWPEGTCEQIESGFRKKIMKMVANKKLLRPYEYMDKDYSQIKECNKSVKKFIQRMQYYYSNFKYVAVAELQKRNIWHYHVICNLPCIDHRELWRLWGNGSVYISKVSDSKKLKKLESYMTKQMTGFADQQKLCGENGYLHSRGLNKSLVARSWKADDRNLFLDEEKKLKSVPKQLDHISTNIYAGEFTYSTYRIESDRFQMLSTAKKHLRGSLPLFIFKGCELDELLDLKES